jgi:hypothetical protein
VGLPAFGFVGDALERRIETHRRDAVHRGHVAVSGQEGTLTAAVEMEQSRQLRRPLPDRD